MCIWDCLTVRSLRPFATARLGEPVCTLVVVNVLDSRAGAGIGLSSCCNGDGRRSRHRTSVSATGLHRQWLAVRQPRQLVHARLPAF